IVVPLVEFVFGVQPDALQKRVTFQPQLPSGWENLSLENLPVGNNIVSISRSKTDRGIEFKLTSKDSAWHLVLKLQKSAGMNYYLNGKEIPFAENGFHMNGTENILVVSPQMNTDTHR